MKHRFMHPCILHNYFHMENKYYLSQFLSIYNILQGITSSIYWHINIPSYKKYSWFLGSNNFYKETHIICIYLLHL